MLPDGRILVVASQQFALGDGVRWETFRQSPTDVTAAGGNVGVDHAGNIYVGTPTGFSRVEFIENNIWRPIPIASWPPGEQVDRSVPRTEIEVGGEWFWHSGSGSLISWKPGQTVQLVAHANDLQNVFSLNGSFYFSDRNDGGLYRINAGRTEPVFAPDQISPNTAITCALSFDEQIMLLGTLARGLQLFDGTSLHAFSAGTTLSGVGRINDLCKTEGGMFAAAVENYGIVFFNREGRLVHSLTRLLDHRLSGVKRLLPAAGGVIWGLLDHGILRVEFPSSISYFEPLVGTGVNTAHPNRVDGRLWFLADGKIQRGVYDVDGRLAQLETDMPSGLYAVTLSSAMGVPVAGTEHGAYYRTNDGWIPFAPHTDYLRILEGTSRNGRWFYGAHGEMGWLRRTDKGIEIERIPAPGLDAYNAATDRNGQIWVERGSGRLARITFDRDQPKLETFDGRDGIPESWAQIFELNGEVRFNVAEQILRFDETTHHFVPDPELSQLTSLHEIYGRPGIDSDGQLWISSRDGVQVFKNENGHWQNLHKKLSARFRPYYFTFESNGVVWLHSAGRLERYDPAMPVVPRAPGGALITQVNVAGANRSFFPANGKIPSLDFSENSLIVHFAAPGIPFNDAVTFDVKLEGAESDWTSAGSAGSAAFNRLKEGNYILHVRPRSHLGSGNEAALAFSIRPPWYRTTFAYFAYALSGVVLLFSLAWVSSFLERRETTRLEQLVSQRTRELNASNDRLAHQVEEIRMLSQAIDQSPVSVFITRPDGTIVFANPRAGESNGYFLNELISKNLRMLRSGLDETEETADNIAAALQAGNLWRGQLINRHKDGSIVHVRTMIAPIRSPDGSVRHHLVLEEDITEWLSDQDRRRRLEAQLFQAQKSESIGTLAGGIAHDFNNILTGILGYCELARLAAEGNPEVQSELKEVFSAGMRAKDLIAQILTFSRQSNPRLIPLELAEPVAEALKLIRATTPSTIQISGHSESGRVRADATQIQQVVLNLCTNAIHAMRDQAGLLTVNVQRIIVDSTLASEVPNLAPGASMRLTVADNGQGMDAATVDRIFDPFFTTKRQGEGTGLGLAIVQGIVAAHRGALRVRSTPKTGTIFEIYLAVTEEARPTAPDITPVPRGANEEVIVVDDERAVATFAATRLQQFGYSTTMFCEPRAALGAFTESPQRYVAIVTDLTMPHLTGLELIKQIRALGRMIPAVIVTGYGSDSIRANLDAIPRCIVLQKPFSGEDLARALHRVLNSSNDSKQ